MKCFSAKDYAELIRFAAMLMMTVIGMLVGMFSPFLAQLTTVNSEYFLTLDEASWVASLSSPGRLLGAICASISAHYLGSKRAMLIGGAPLLLAWIFLILADSAFWLYGTSLAHGLAMGIAFVSFPIYLGEVGSPAIRGALVSYAVSGFPLGSLVGNVLGTYLNKTTFAYIALVPTIIYILIFLWVPESSHFFVKVNNLEAARRSIHRYDPKANVEVELESLQKFVAASNSLSFLDRLKELKTTRNRKAGLTLLLLYMFMQFSGLNTVVYYMEIILKRANVTAILPATVVIIANVLDCIAGWMAMTLADKYGRKAMWISSSCGACASMIAIGSHFSVLYSRYESNGIQWLSIVFMIFFRVFLFIGLTSVPSIYLSELIAPNIKSVVACLANVFAGLFAFISTKSYQPLVDAIGEAYVFYLYAIIMILSVIFGLTMLPETKGKTLQEIQNLSIRK